MTPSALAPALTMLRRGDHPGRGLTVPPVLSWPTWLALACALALACTVSTRPLEAAEPGAPAPAPLPAPVAELAADRPCGLAVEPQARADLRSFYQTLGRQGVESGQAVATDRPRVPVATPGAHEILAWNAGRAEALRLALTRLSLSATSGPFEMREPAPGTAAVTAACADIGFSLAAWQAGWRLWHGQVGPRAVVDRDWRLPAPEFDGAGLLTRLHAAASAPADPSPPDALAGTLHAELMALRPSHPGYLALQAARQGLQQTLQLEGDWPVPQGLPRRLDPGDRHPAVPLLRARLQREGSLPVAEVAGGTTADPDAAVAVPGSDPDHYDVALVEAVQRFQARHGLKPDGVVGRATQALLAHSLADRLALVDANLERWHWLPRDLGERYLWVNLPAFRLELWQQGQLARVHRVIVGRTDRATPVLADSARRLILNPDWNVPRSIAVKDYLPKQQEDGTALEHKGLRVFDRSGAPVDPAEIDWASLSGADFPYRLYQPPGRDNALGQIKFPLSNPYAIYLHDTPSRRLFERDRRAFSSGCVRVQQPLELAAHLLAPEDPVTARAQIDTWLESPHSRSVTLPEPVPVYLVYFTVWVGEDGALRLAEDLYRRDAPLLRALADRP